MSAIPVILDTDPGVDDALALMLALRCPELEVLGVCTVNGNVPLDVGTRNALRVLGLLGRTDVPVYSGADRPLRREPVYATEVHGLEGLGETELPDPGVASVGDGVAFLVETLCARPGEVTVVAVGPLTNLALAEQRLPGVLKQARSVVVMGGALDEPGNSAPTAEFNFFADPDAARMVVRSGARLTLVTLDATHQVALDVDVLQERVLSCGTSVSHFLAGAVRPAMAYGKRLTGYEGFYLHDPMAVGFVVNPGLFRVEDVFLDVEAKGVLTAGQVVMDRRPYLEDARRKGYRVACVLGVDVDGFLDMFLQRVLQAGIA
ncbi:MAG: nucleoside hydrolase [bacterium]|nr:nucleoside hydrolase [bacterium]